jgi:tetratricopeptide (TPR) repeat protein
MKSAASLPVAIASIILLATPAARAQNVTVAEPKVGVSLQESVLASAKNLYASASYEAALLELSSSDARDDADQIDTYRALCLLALDRRQDAERALEGIVARKPTYAINDAEYSPRLVAMFRDVRKRALPGAAQTLYAAAKADFEAKDYPAAIPKLRQLLSVLGDPDAGDDLGRLKDLRELADGFLKLSEQRLEATAPARVASSPTPPPTSAPAAAAAPLTTPAYSNVDSAIKPPVVVNQAMPEWRMARPLTYVPDRVYSGRLEVIINEQGAVEKATLLKSVWPTYDPALLQAAKLWRYEPALKDGQPVKFIKYLDITVGSPGRR